MDPHTLVKRCVELGADEAEVYMLEKVEYSVTGENGVVKDPKYSVEKNCAIRLVVEGGAAAASIPADVCGADEVIKALVKAARLRRGEGYSLPQPTKVQYVEVPRIDVSRLNIVDVVEAVKSASVAEKLDLLSVHVTLQFIRRRIVNSRGVDLVEEHFRFYPYVFAKAVSGTTHGMYSRHEVLAEPNLDILPDWAADAAEKARMQLRKEGVDAGRFTVVFSPKVVTAIVTHGVTPAFHADAVLDGRSPIKVGEKIGADGLTIVDNPRIARHPYARSFDDEGVETKRVTLIEDGVVKGIVTDHITSRKLRVENTGSAHRYERYVKNALHTLPRPAATNVCIRFPAEDTLENILRDLKNALLVEHETNSHTIDPTSGNASIIAVSAWIVKDGEVKSAAKPFTLTFNTYRHFLTNIAAVSKEKETHESFIYPTAINAPYIAVENVPVTP